MPRRILALAALSLGTALLVFPAQPAAPACAPVMAEGAQVHIASESALIVWDEKAKKQHFIRRASFDTRVPYFGFLVPTPTPPELAEAPDELFTLLEDWTRPEVKTEKLYRAISLLPRLEMSAGLDADAPAGAVAVLDQGRVSGFDYVVIEANDAEKLRRWLGEHGYDARPALTAWLSPYIKAGWIITAFQIAKKEQDADSVSTQAVRMSFAAERPFFPYREPPDEGAKALARPIRLLRVFLIARARMQGAFDDEKATWSGKAVWAGPLDDDRRQKLGKRLDDKAVALPEGAWYTWLTVFDDHASSRLGAPDVFFSPSPDQSELRRPPITIRQVVYYPGLEVLFFTGLLVGLAVLLWRAARRRPGAPA